MRKFKTVIIGMGRMGRTRYDAMMRHGGFEITGICDNDAQRLVLERAGRYEDWKSCIDREQPEVVVV